MNVQTDTNHRSVYQLCDEDGDEDSLLIHRQQQPRRRDEGKGQRRGDGRGPKQTFILFLGGPTSPKATAIQSQTLKVMKMSIRQ